MTELAHSFVRFPSMGEGVFEATVVRWLKEPGAWVEKNTPLIEVSTDKVDTEIIAEQDGYLIATFFKEGEIIKVGKVIAQLSPDKHSAAFLPPENSEISLQKKSAIITPSHATSPTERHVFPSMKRAGAVATNLSQFAGRIPSSPLVRKMAEDYQVDLSFVNGSGLYGRITKNDLVEFLSKEAPHTTPNTSPEPLHLQELCRLKTEVRSEGEFLDGVKVNREAMSSIRKKTAEHMLASIRTSPHVTTTFEIDLHQVRAHRELFNQQNKLKLTYTAYFVYAAAQALQKNPYVNASIDGSDILLKEAINIGCAVATKDGLIVPVIKNAQRMTIEQVGSALQDIVERARTKKLQPTDVVGGTFSITNPGLYGSIHSQPIISQPQVAILSVGAIIDRPVVIGKEIGIRPLCQVGLTFDHRVIDGEGGAKFLADVKKVLEGFL